MSVTQTQRAQVDPLDWADDLAIDLYSDAQRNSFKEAVRIMASRLRILAMEKERDGVERARRIHDAARSAA